MAHRRIQRIQDCVHGLMEFHGIEGVVIELLRTPELQRLRRIKQLGLANYVFPSAEHSRFAHSLGASHLAIRFTRRLLEVAQEMFTPCLCPDEISVRDMAVAALCHDIGHGPYSHAWEREIIGEDFNRRVWIQKLGLPEGAWSDNLKWHELVGHGILAWPDGRLHKLLEQHEENSASQIQNLLLGNYHIPYLPRLLASDIDVDRADFIIRDTRNTGVSYGKYDLDWLISTCSIGEVVNGNQRNWVVGFDGKKSVRVLEQFLIARRALYETVYWHKTVRCAEGMMALFLKRLKIVVRDGSKAFYDKLPKSIVDMINGEAVEQNELMRLDDSSIERIIEAVLSSDIKDPTVRELARRIAERDLFKLVPVDSEKLDTFRDDPDWNSKLCEAVEPYAKGESAFFFFLDSRKFSMMSQDDSEIAYLVDTDGRAISVDKKTEFDSFKGRSQKVHSVFAVREAVTAVKTCIERT